MQTNINRSVGWLTNFSRPWDSCTRLTSDNYLLTGMWLLKNNDAHIITIQDSYDSQYRNKHENTERCEFVDRMLAAHLHSQYQVINKNKRKIKLKTTIQLVTLKNVDRNISKYCWRKYLCSKTTDSVNLLQCSCSRSLPQLQSIGLIYHVLWFYSAS